MEGNKPENLIIYCSCKNFASSCLLPLKKDGIDIEKLIIGITRVKRCENPAGKEGRQMFPVLITIFILYIGPFLSPPAHSIVQIFLYSLYYLPALW